MINNERQLPQQLIQEVTQQSINCKMNGQPTPLMRHQTRHETTLMQTFKAVAIEGYGTDDNKVNLTYTLGNKHLF